MQVQSTALNIYWRDDKKLLLLWGRAIYDICFREADIPQTPRKKSFKSLLNISADEEVLPEATETLQGPATHPNPWRTRQKKKERCRCPPIVFQSAESEIEAHSDICAPPFGARAKLQPRENCQAAHTIKDDLEPRSIILYGVPPYFDASPASRVEHDIAQLQMIFGRLLPSDQPVTIEVLLSCKDDIVGRYLTTAEEEFLHPSITQPTHFRMGNRLSMLDLVLSEFPDTTSAIKLLARVGNNDHALLSFRFGLHHSHKPTVLCTLCYNERMKGFTGEGATLLDWNEDIGEIKTVPMVKFLLILEISRINYCIVSEFVIACLPPPTPLL